MRTGLPVGVSDSLSPRLRALAVENAMLRPVDSLEFGELRSPPFRAPAINPSSPVSLQPAPESVEQEISRLTWTVLDGSASLGDRQRLAELVNEQHARRRR
jgi:hypothetical protein